METAITESEQQLPLPDQELRVLIERRLAAMIVIGKLHEVAPLAKELAHDLQLIAAREVMSVEAILGKDERYTTLCSEETREVIREEKRKKNIQTNLRWAVWERDNFTCHYCGSRRFLSIDHKVAESEGGQMTMDNLVTACRTCNCRKGSKLYETFVQQITRERIFE